MSDDYKPTADDLRGQMQARSTPYEDPGSPRAGEATGPLVLTESDLFGLLMGLRMTQNESQVREPLGILRDVHALAMSERLRGKPGEVALLTSDDRDLVRRMYRHINVTQALLLKVKLSTKGFTEPATPAQAKLATQLFDCFDLTLDELNRLERIGGLD